METTTENRDHINQFLAHEANRAATDLAELQSKLADRLGKGTFLDWSDLESLAEAQADAEIWAKTTRMATYWGEHPDGAPEVADLTEAAHTMRATIIRDAIGYAGPTSSSGMSNELERAAQRARRSFLDRTGMIYPEGSPLRRLGR